MRIFYITLLILGAILFAPNLVFAAELPSECLEDGYEITIVGDNNFDPIDTGNGKDCVLVGDNNSGSIDSGNGGDIIVVGNNNTGNINGGTGVDIIIVGYDNSGNILGGNGADIIKIGYGNTGTINGENGPDVIVNIPRVPSATPVSGSYTSIQHITLTSGGAASIHYTTDGTVPDCLSSTYTEPVSIFSTKTIKAVGCSVDGGISGIGTFIYTIEEIEADTEDMSSLVALFVPTASTSGVTVAQNLKINVSTDSGSSQVVLEKDTEITRSDEQALNISDLISSQADINILTGLTMGKVFEAALQWGIPDTTLQFSKPITIKIFIGAEFNGKTLDIVRSPDGENWTSDGIVAPATCVVTDGICSFQATLASYYAALGNAPASAPAGAVGLAFVNSGAGTLPSPAPVAEVIQTPILTPEITPKTTPVVVASVPKKQAVSKAVAPKITTKVQPTRESTPAIEVEQKLKPEKKNLLAGILSSIFNLFHWPF